jgi:cation:H+ antiporter
MSRADLAMSNVMGSMAANPGACDRVFFGLKLVRSTDSKPMWFPRHTRQTVPDQPDPNNHGSLVTACFSFVVLAGVTGLSGWALMENAKVVSDQTGLSGRLDLS